MSKTCLFIVNGLGMGNSTRCHAVIEHLAEANCEVHVLTSGNGLTYFEGKRCVRSVTPMASFFYSGTRTGISGWSTLKSLFTLYGISRTKRRQVAEAAARIQPDLVVIDSEYTLAPLRRRGIPIIALNTSEMVVDRYLKQGGGAGTRSQFWFVEFADYLFHRHYCDLVLSPFPLRTPTRYPARFKRIGLIIRSQLQQAAPRTGTGFPAPRELKRVVFMLSGSVHASRIRFGEHSLPFQVDVVGRSGESRKNLTYHGRQMNNTGLLANADALVINGGYSAVSEAFWLRKPVFVIPISGHAEQYVNACLVRDLGLGFVATEEDVLPQLLEMYQRDEWIGRKLGPERFEIDGAREAAEVILEHLGLPAAVALPKAVGWR